VCDKGNKRQLIFPFKGKIRATTPCSVRWIGKKSPTNSLSRTQTHTLIHIHTHLSQVGSAIEWKGINHSLARSLILSFTLSLSHACTHKHTHTRTHTHTLSRAKECDRNPPCQPTLDQQSAGCSSRFAQKSMLSKSIFVLFLVMHRDANAFIHTDACIHS